MRIRIASTHCTKIIVQTKNRGRRTYWHECRVILITYLSALCEVRGRQPVTFFGAHTKLRKATISFAMAFCTHRTTCLPLNGLS